MASILAPRPAAPSWPRPKSPAIRSPAGGNWAESSRSSCPTAIFTPLVDDRLDEARLVEYLDAWLDHVDRNRIFGGGASSPGWRLSGRMPRHWPDEVRRRLKDAVIAVGGDPHLESWLAFMGNCADLSRAYCQSHLLEPRHWRRHDEPRPGPATAKFSAPAATCRRAAYSSRARQLSKSFELSLLCPPVARTSADRQAGRRIARSSGKCGRSSIGIWNCWKRSSAENTDMQASPTRSLASTGAVRAAATDRRFGHHVIGRRRPVGVCGSARIRLAFDDGLWRFGNRSGPTTWRKRHSGNSHLQAFQPTALGRATVYGLLRYNTQVSGSTIYLSDPDVLPLPDLIILGSVIASSSPAESNGWLRWPPERPPALACGSNLGATAWMTFDHLAAKIRQALLARPVASPVPLVLIDARESGKSVRAVCDPLGYIADAAGCAADCD